MARRFRKKQKEHIPTDIMEILNLTPLMDIMTVLVVFLLISAIFLTITIQELSVPTAAGGSGGKPNFSIEVIVRKGGLELGNGSSVEAAIPKKDDHYDLDTLSKLLVRLKSRYPDKEDATILLEPKIEYDYLVQVMDAVREADVPAEGSKEISKIILFPKISLGDAP